MSYLALATHETMQGTREYFEPTRPGSRVDLCSTLNWTHARNGPASFVPTTAVFVAEDNIIAGNMILYGATSGGIFVRGEATSPATAAS